MRRIGFGLGAVLLVAALLGAPKLATGATVDGNFNCTVSLPNWPTEFGGGGVHCLGTMNAVFQGSTGSGATLLAYAVRAPMDAYVSSYNEKCSAGSQALSGSANGTVSLTSLQVVRPVGVSASATAPFRWHRIGVVGFIEFGPGLISLSNGDTSGWTGGADALFRIVTPVVPRDCIHPGPITAQISGAAHVLGLPL